VAVDVCCDYTRGVLERAVRRHGGAAGAASKPALLWADFESTPWTEVVGGEGLGASSFPIRKGLSRKAQLARAIEMHVAKNPSSALASGTPRTVVVETWAAFDDGTAEPAGGGGFNASAASLAGALGGEVAAAFGGADAAAAMRVPLAQRLAWCLADARDAMAEAPGAAWILKPSATNKGTDVTVVETLAHVELALLDRTEQREWVLQRYVDRPLLHRGRKFHVRAYVLANGCA